MGQIEDLQAKGFGSHGGKTWTVENDIIPVGSQQEDVKVGQWVMVAHGRWSRAFKVKKENTELEVRMIDENDILLVSDDEPKDEVALKAGYINMGGAKQMTKLPGND